MVESVGMIHSEGSSEGIRHDLSSYGFFLDFVYPGVDIDVYKMGSDVLVENESTGTSISTPLLVSGFILAYSAYYDFEGHIPTKSQILDLAYNAAEPARGTNTLTYEPVQGVDFSLSFNEEYGYGIIDFYDLINYLKKIYDEEIGSGGGGSTICDPSTFRVLCPS